MLSLWQSRPIFLTGGAWHPLTIALGLHGTVYEVALLLLGIVTSLLAIHRYAASPSRGRWLTCAIALMLAILSTSSATWPALLLIAAAWVWISARSPHQAECALGVMVAMTCAAFLAAPWWLPAVRVGRELAKGGAPPRFSFAETLTAVEIPAKILSLSHGNLPHVGAGGSVALLSAGTEIRADVVSQGWNLLVSNVPWWDGWRVYWNNDRLPPVRVNERFVGTFVPPGRATLRLRYHPVAFDEGLRLALAGLVLLVITAWWQWPILAAPHAEKALRTLVGRMSDFVPRRLPSLAPVWRRFAALARQGSRVVPWLPAVMLVVYSAILIVNRIDVAGGADSSGYLNQTRLWTEGRLIVPAPGEAWIPLGFAPGPRPQTMVPTYPPGLPLQMALMRLTGGAQAPFLFPQLAAIAGILLLYRLARDLNLSRSLSVCAAALLALCPVFIFQAIQPMSDGVATCWAIAALICAFRGAKDTRFALLAGACLGAGVLVRPTQILLLPAILIALGLSPKRLISLVAGGLPFALAQMAISRHLYGNPLATGYGNVLAMLKWSYFPERFTHYCFWLAALLSPVIFPIGFFGLASSDVAPRVRGVLAASFAPFFLFYCFYLPYETWWYTRFLLPGIPALILAALFLLRRVQRIPRAVVLAGIFALELLMARHFDVLSYGAAEQTYLDAARLLPPDGVTLSMQMSGAIYYYAGRLTLRYDAINPEQFEAVRARGGPVYALVSDWELPELRARTGGEWVPMARVHDVTLLKLRL